LLSGTVEIKAGKPRRKQKIGSADCFWFISKAVQFFD
jgi:hypothetical protein